RCLYTGERSFYLECCFGPHAGPRPEIDVRLSTQAATDQFHRGTELRYPQQARGDQEEQRADRAPDEGGTDVRGQAGTDVGVEEPEHAETGRDTRNDGQVQPQQCAKDVLSVKSPDTPAEYVTCDDQPGQEREHEPSGH